MHIFLPQVAKTHTILPRKTVTKSHLSLLSASSPDSTFLKLKGKVIFLIHSLHNDMRGSRKTAIKTPSSKGEKGKHTSHWSTPLTTCCWTGIVFYSASGVRHLFCTLGKIFLTYCRPWSFLGELPTRGLWIALGI